LIIVGFALAFSLPPNYELNKATAKQTILWNYVLADNGQPGTWYSVLIMPALFLRSDWVTGHIQLDTMPDDRYKLIHTVGAVAKAQFVWVDNPYTGMFKSAKNLVMRLSAAAAPDATNLTPALSIKALRDGIPSGNIIGMFELDGWTQLNYFQDMMCTHIADNPDLPTKFKLIGTKFKLQSSYPNLLGLSEFASFTESGAKVTSPIFPWVLIFQNNPALKAKMAGNTDLDVGHVLTQILNGHEVLYKVFAIDNPWSTTATYLGYLQLTSSFRESKFADLTLFYKHTFIEDDLAFRPDWEKYYSDPKYNRWEKEGLRTYGKYIPAWTDPK